MTFPEDDNTCTYCKKDNGENEISCVTECVHFVSSDQCSQCPTNQVCFDCDKKSNGTISDAIAKFDPWADDENEKENARLTEYDNWVYRMTQT